MQDKTKTGDISQKVFDAAFALLEWTEGDTELARGLWADAFEEAERIDHNQSLGELDEHEGAIDEQRRRFDKAIAARQRFHVIKELKKQE